MNRLTAWNDLGLAVPEQETAYAFLDCHLTTAAVT